MPSPIFLFLHLLTTTTTSHFSPSSSPSSNSVSPEWRAGHATYYTAADPRDAVGGACGYGDLARGGYGIATVGVSEAVFERVQIRRACFEVRCIEDLRWCIPGTSIILTATNFCPPNYGFSGDAGEDCNPPSRHFVLPIEVFEKIAIWKQWRSQEISSEGTQHKFSNKIVTSF